jgi:hypothetical protein
LLMAPSLYHRVRWNQGGKEDVIRVGHALFLADTACLALGMLCAVFVVVDFLSGAATAIVSVIVLLAQVAVTWCLLPIEHGRDPRIRQTE